MSEEQSKINEKALELLKSLAKTQQEHKEDIMVLAQFMKELVGITKTLNERVTALEATHLNSME
jgi:hypothetical protein